MGVQILEGDWNDEVAGTTSAGGTTTKHPSARQRRWTAFRSWYRGGRVFDRADETLIAAATLRRPPSPASLGRPLTPRMAPADGPQPAAPTTVEEEVIEPPPLTSTGGGETGGSESPAVRPEVAAVSAAETDGTTVKGPGTAPVTPLEGVSRERRTTPPAPPAPPGATVHVTLLKNKPTPPVRRGSGTGEIPAAAREGHETSVQVPAKDDGPLRDEADLGVDAARLAGIAGWDAEEEGGEQSLSGDDGVCAEGQAPKSRQSGTAAAKRLRMEARRKFLAARTVNSKRAAKKVSRTWNRLLGPLAWSKHELCNCVPNPAWTHLLLFPSPPVSTDMKHESQERRSNFCPLSPTTHIPNITKYAPPDATTTESRRPHAVLVKPGRAPSGRETRRRQGKAGGGGGLGSGRPPRKGGGGKEKATAQPGGEGPGTQAGRRAPGRVGKGGRDPAAAGLARDAATGGCEVQRAEESGYIQS